MHSPPCVLQSRNCLLGEEGHCAQCPHRGLRNNPRYILVQKLKSWAYTVHKGYPVLAAQLKMGPELATILWPENEREWIEREDRWIERANYHSEMAAKALMKELLRERYDAREALNIIATGPFDAMDMARIAMEALSPTNPKETL